MTEQTTNFIGYDYMEITASRRNASLCIDGYQSFGWKLEGSRQDRADTMHLSFKRDRKIANKPLLAKLQRQFESCVSEIDGLEHSKHSVAMITAFTIGLIGTALLGGATFAYLAGMLPAMIVLAVPGFIGWALPYFVYHKILRRKSQENAPIIDQMNDEIYSLCEKGTRLIHA